MSRAFLLRYTNFRPIGSFASQEKEHFTNYLSSFLKNAEYRVSTGHQVFTRKGLNATEISKKLDNVYKDDAPSYRTVVK